MSAQLTKKLVHTLPWAFGESVFNIVYGISTVVLIGRFIAPAELGAASAPMAAVLLIGIVSSAGIPEAVVRSRSGDTLVTDTAFVLSVIFAVLGMGVCALAAFPLAALYGDDRLATLMFSASFILPLDALAAVPSAIMMRKMRAAKLTKRLIGGRTLGLLTLCMLAAGGWGAWSVVLSNLAASFGSLAMIWTATKRFPRLRLARNEVPALLRFGAMISMESALYAATARAFSLLFGYFHGLEALGNFQFAWRLGEEAASLIQTSVNRFGLSFFAGKERMAADPASSFVIGSQLITSFTTPLFAGIALVSGDFIPLIFGSRWQATIPFLQIIALSLLIHFQRILTGPALRAKGQQRLMVTIAASRFAIALISCIATASLPPIYGVLGFASRLILAVPYMAAAIARHLRISLRAQFCLLIGPTLAAAAMAIAVLSFQFALEDTQPLSRLLGSIPTGAAAYAIALWFLNPALFSKAMALLMRHSSRDK